MLLLLLAVPLSLEAQDKMEPPGDCIQEEHRRLKQEVGRACKAVSMVCTASQDCEALWKNLSQYQSCIAARQLIAVKCFRGGDETHLREIGNYRSGAEQRCPPPACN
jgi:hypothetical protein